MVGFDSFAGFSPGASADVGPRVDAPGVVAEGWDDTSVALIQSLLDAPAELVAGFFTDTLPGALPGRISLLHVDCDLYDPTRLVLEFALPRMSAGGVVVFDEYRQQTRWPGATVAVDGALASHGTTPTWDPLLQRYLLRIDEPLTAPAS